MNGNKIKHRVKRVVIPCDKKVWLVDEYTENGVERVAVIECEAMALAFVFSEFEFETELQSREKFDIGGKSYREFSVRWDNNAYASLGELDNFEFESQYVYLGKWAEDTGGWFAVGGVAFFYEDEAIQKAEELKQKIIESQKVN